MTVQALREVPEAPEDDGEALLAGLTSQSSSEPLPSPWARENRALLAAYFSAGFALAFLGTPLGFYMVAELNAPPAQQASVWTAMSLVSRRCLRSEE